MTTQAPRAKLDEQFHWEPQPAAQQLIRRLLQSVLDRCPGAGELDKKLSSQAGVRLLDCVDHFRCPADDALAGELQSVGFTKESLPGAPACFTHHGAMFPRVVFAQGPLAAAVKVESVADFLACWKLDVPIEGEPLAQVRRARAFEGQGAELWVIERHGYIGFDIPKSDAGKRAGSLAHLENFRRRRRDFGIGPRADEQGFAHVQRLVDAAVKDLGVDWACDLFFAAERDYWQRRNRAGRVQKARQDAVGIGWANHDHHTYRSSRHCFVPLIATLEKLGFRCRERFYAGHEAGWGAQVIEQPVAGITIFADVDMSPEELLGDFSHAPMPERKELGTIGLWCALHGEAMLQAGLHHLECQFDWHALKDQLAAEASIKTMDPFTTFPYLRQAFTEGERWAVDGSRVEAVLARGQITAQQAQQFRTQGALGSHLENLERNDGYKGFNQTGVSQIIAKTDPRKQAALAGA